MPAGGGSDGDAGEPATAGRAADWVDELGVLARQHESVSSRRDAHHRRHVWEDSADLAEVLAGALELDVSLGVRGPRRLRGVVAAVDSGAVVLTDGRLTHWVGLHAVSWVRADRTVSAGMAVADGTWDLTLAELVDEGAELDVWLTEGTRIRGDIVGVGELVRLRSADGAVTYASVGAVTVVSRMS